ncbi:MAG: hypothetical protein ACYC6Y_03685 [Thermoguttaceae bacterium]
MSDYERLEAAPGDPWSTEPVGNHARPARETDSGAYHDDSQVVARMPHVGDDAANDRYRGHGEGRSGSRRRRSASARPGVPAPVWVLIGMGLVVLIAAPFMMARKSGNEAALDGPGWEVDMPAPNAEVAPTWSPGEANPQWQQPGGWNQGASPTTTVTAEPSAPTAWGGAGEWVGAPSNAPYARNAADPRTPQMPDDRGVGSIAADPSAYPSATAMGQSQGGVWDSSIPPVAAGAPATTPYQDTPPSATGYPTAASAGAGGWSEPATPPGAAPRPSFDMTSPMPGSNSWEQPAPSLAAPQPENVAPGYGTYPAPQPNPYVTAPANTPGGAASSYAGAQRALTASPYAATAPAYGATAYPPAEAYPSPGYPQTAMSPRPAPIGSLPAGVTAGYPAPSASPMNSYQPGMPNPYGAPNGSPAPAGQPYYGSAVSPTAGQPNVARLNGTIQEPAARQAYDDRARPSYY